MFSKYILSIFGVGIIALTGMQVVLASDSVIIAGTGCFVRTQDTTTATYTMRMTTPSCQITAQNSTNSTQVATVMIENIDPDYVTVDNYDTTSGLIKTDNTLQFKVNLVPGENTVQIAPWYNYGDDFYFVATSDNQSQGTVEVNPVLTQILRQVSVINPVFFTNSGDLIQGSVAAEEAHEMYDVLLETLIDESTVPMYPVPGNHDVWSENIFQEHFGVTDYTFDFGAIQFVALSTTVLGKSKGGVSTQQLSWLQNTLSATTQRNVLWFHHPLQVPEWGKPTCCFISKSNRDQLISVIDANTPEAVLVGHSQGYDDDTLTMADNAVIKNGIRQFVIGGAGGKIAQPDMSHFFVLMHVTPTAIVPTRVAYDTFATSVTYATNDGNNTKATAEVNNAAITDVPYVRLKFKITNTANPLTVFDSTGKSYSNYYRHDFSEYTVIYLDVAAPAKSDIVYTIAQTVSSKLHSTFTVASPASHGQPQVRLFDNVGKNLASWYALNTTATGSYHTLVSDVTGDGITEILVYTGGGSTGKFGVYSNSGEELYLATPYGNQFKAGIQLQAMDLTQDGVNEIVITPLDRTGVVQIYHYAITTDTYELFSTQIVSPYITGVQGLLAVATKGKRNTMITLYQYDVSQSELVVVAKKMIRGTFATMRLITGDVSGSGQAQIVLYLGNARSEKILIFNGTGRDILQQKKQRRITTRLQGDVQMKVVPVTGQAQGVLLLWSNTNPYVLGFTQQANHFLKLFKIFPYGKKSLVGLNFGIIDTNGDGTVELVTAPTAGIPKIKVWQYNIDQRELQQHASWLGYQTNFRGGVNIAQ